MDFYKNRIQRFAEEEKTCERQNNRYTWLRLAIIVSAISAGIVLFSVSAWLGAGVALVLLAGFAVILKKHLTNMELQQQKERLKNINQYELNCLDGDFSAYPSGSQYDNAKHYYTSDLDIFGAHSVFRFLNRTTSPSGSDMLADWLSKPANTSEIVARQQAVKELSDMVDFRQEIQSIGLKHKDISKELPGFTEWLHSKTELSDNRKLLCTMRILPFVTLAAITAAVIGAIPSVFVWLLIITHFAISGLTMRKVNYLHQQVSRKVNLSARIPD